MAQKEGTSTDLQYLHDQLCTNFTFAYNAGFNSFNYIKVDTSHDRSSELDYESISEYTSIDFRAEWC